MHGSDGKKLRGRPRRRWEDNIKINFKALYVGHVLSSLAPDRDKYHDLVNTVLIQYLIIIYIFLQQIWQYFRKECGILVSKSITIFHQPLNNCHMIFLNLKRP